MTTSRRPIAVDSGVRFTLRTLGRPALVDSSAPNEQLPLRGKQFALLAYLACRPGREASRASLIDLFAPEPGPERQSADGKASDAVRNIIQQVRSKLGSAALGSHRSDPVRLELALTSDRDELLAAWARRDYRAVVDLHGGDFLPGFETVATPSFAHWVEGERADLRRRFGQAARYVIAQDLTDANSLTAARRALALARRLRDHDRLAQDAWQLLVRCHILCGEHGDAALEADRLEEFLAAQHVEPDPATRAVLKTARVDAARVFGSVAASQSSNGRTVFANALVGRSAEVAALVASWDKARVGSLIHVHVVARAGLGKSALLADVHQRLRARPAGIGGTRPVEVRANQGLRELPYAFATALARALAERPGALGVAEWVAGVLVSLSPSLSQIYQSARVAGPAFDADRPGMVSRALQELIAAVALEGPLAIFLDDLHWSDQESIGALSSSLQGCAELPVLVVSAARDACQALCAQTGALQIELGPLDTGSVAQILTRTSALPAEPWADRLPHALWETTGGSPLLLVETIQLLLERELLAITPSAWQTSDADGLFAALDEGRATRRRIERLTAAERRLLLLLAVAGSPLSSGRLRDAAGQTLAEFNASLTALDRRGFVARQGDDWTLAHDEHARAALETSDDAAMSAAAAAIGRAIVEDAGDDLRELRRAGPLLARGSDTTGIVRAFERFARLSRRQHDRRSARALAREFLGDGSTDAGLVQRCVSGLPLDVRVRAFSRRGGVALLSGAVLTLAVAIVVAIVAMRPRQPLADAVIAASRIAKDHKSRELFPVSLDASHWAGISVIDVPIPGQPRWSLPIGNGGTSLRPDGRGWTFGAAMSDSGVLDVLDIDLDGHVRRLTFGGSDDYQPSWAPDGSRFVFVTATWSQRGHYDLAVYDTLTKKVQQLTRGDDTDWEPQWSPDGGRIAFIRQYADHGRRGLCLMDADGTHLRCLSPEPTSDLRLLRWADERHVLVNRVAADTVQLQRLDLETGATEPLDNRGTEVQISPDGRFVLCKCPRPGYPPGTWIVYPLERPNEFAMLRVVGDEPNAVDFEWAPTTPRLPWVSRVSISLGLGPPQLRAPHQLRVAAATRAGKPVAAGVVRWRSEDTSVAIIDSSGLLTPRRAGRVTIDASAGGWREARMTITIADSPSRVLLDETWTHGIEPAWRTFGVPRPLLVHGALLGHAFLNNGDGSFFSGAYTRSAFATRDGLWVSAELSTPITATESQEQVISLFQIVDSAAWQAWDHITADGPPVVGSAPSLSFRYPSGVGGRHFGEQFLIARSSTQTGPVPQGSTAGRPFPVVMQIFPDGHSAVAINNKVVWRDASVFAAPSVHVMLAGNSVDTKILVGRVQVATGIAPGIRW